MSYENVNLKEATIIDVRTPGEFCMGCVDGSINIPLDQVPQKIEDFKKEAEDLNQRIEAKGLYFEYTGPWPAYNFSSY